MLWELDPEAATRRICDAAGELTAEQWQQAAGEQAPTRSAELQYCSRACQAYASPRWIVPPGESAVVVESDAIMAGCAPARGRAHPGWISRPDDGTGCQGGRVARLLKFAVDDDTPGVVVVELDDQEVPDDLVLSGRSGAHAVEQATVTLQQALETLRPALARVTEFARSVSPAEASVEIGLKLGGETGLIIAKGHAEANLKLKLVWK